MVRFVKKTPLVDGVGLKNTLENRIAPFLESKIGGFIREKKAFITVGVDRWGMSKSFLDSGYACTFGDLMFALGIPIPLHSEKSLKTLAAILMPVAGHLPFEWVYPTGEKQEKRTPRWENYYQAASVIAGDCHYVKRYMPYHLQGKVIATNTTTPSDVEAFRQAGVKYLVTSTPVLEGRSFGTNMMEAALVALAGKGRSLTRDELNQLLDQIGLEPQLQELN
jgi:hypothetical protein